MINKILPVLFLLTLPFLIPAKAKAAVLTGSSVLIYDPRPSQVGATYTIDWNGVSAGVGSTVKCILVKFSSSTSSFTVPTGMLTAGASVVNTSTDFVPTIGSWTTDVTVNGQVKLTYATGEIPASSTGRTVTLKGITNGSVANNNNFVLFNTYGNVDCSTSPIDSGTGVFVYTNGQLVSLTIDPTLSFAINPVSLGTSVNSQATTVTTTSTTIPFGTVNTAINAVAAHDLTVATNTGSGYTVYTRYTGTLANLVGSTIPDHSGTNVAPSTFTTAGTAGFGYTSEDFTLGTGTANRFQSNKWAGFTTTNSELAYNNQPVATQTTRVGYQVGIAPNTPAGSYSTTVIMTVVPAF